MSNVIDINIRKKKKVALRPDISPKDEGFGARMNRIKISLERINALMAELKRMSKDK